MGGILMEFWGRSFEARRIMIYLHDYLPKSLLETGFRLLAIVLEGYKQNRI